VVTVEEANRVLAEENAKRLKAGEQVMAKTLETLKGLDLTLRALPILTDDGRIVAVIRLQTIQKET
jgi:hypothetical protein